MASETTALNIKSEIPSGELIVRTENSVYRFGKANADGIRTVSRDDNPLGSSRCKINKLELNEQMRFLCLNGTHKDKIMFTSLVRSID